MAVYTNLIETEYPFPAIPATYYENLLNTKNKTDLPRGLLILLVSKAGKSDSNENILPNQRKLAEITERIHTEQFLHYSMLQLPTKHKNQSKERFRLLICGDFTQSHFGLQLMAECNNIKIVELFGQARKDYNAAESMDMDKYNALDWWTQQTKMKYGTLLSHALQSTLILGGNMDLLESAKQFGVEVALAWQANIDLQSYMNTTTRAEHTLTKMFPPGTAFEEIVSSFEAVRDKHINASLKALTNFPQNDASRALHDIAKALKY